MHENLINKWTKATKAIEWVEINQLELFTKNEVKVDIKVQFKRSIMKMKFENQRPKA